MKAFISYSINDSEHFVLTLLSQKLRREGFGIASSYGKTRGHFYTIDALASKKIREASLFVGVITANGHSNGKVIAEHHCALSHKTPALLLVEDSVSLSPDFTDSNVVFFNRQYPQKAINEINKQMTASNKTKQKNAQALAWLFGGIALSGLVSLLSTNN